MSYVNEKMDPRADSAEMRTGCVPPMEMESMVAMMNEVGCIASDVLQMAQKVNISLFGMGNSINCDSQKNDVSKCFVDKLERTKANLLMTAEEMKRLIDRLGV